MTLTFGCWIFASSLSILFAEGAGTPAKLSPSATERSEASKGRFAGDRFFSESQARVFDIQVPESALASLTRDNRSYVKAVVAEGEKIYRDVGLRLKGKSSFRPVHEKPALTLKFDEFVPGQTHDGLKKLLLNNAVFDSTCLNELLAANLFQRAGVPAGAGDTQPRDIEWS